MTQSEKAHAFDGKAEAYALNRLDYAPEAIAAIVTIAGLDKASVIADLGSGPGTLAGHFAKRVGRLFAVEPNDEMRALAQSKLGGIASAVVMNGTADNTGLPARSVHAVMAGRALQWFDPAPTQTEIRRILRPGGWLIVVRTPVTDALSIDALERLRDERITGHARKVHSPLSEVEMGAWFGGDNFIRLSYPGTARETWSQFLGRMQSLSFSPQPGEASYGEFERVARDIFERGSRDGLLHVEYATEVFMKEMVPGTRVPGALPFLETEIESDIVTRFEHVAASVPNGIAVKADGRDWTYARLDAWANAIAEIVLRHSLDRTAPVALLFDHGAAGIASIIGVLKAGRPFCAISPAHPVERHRETLANVEARLLLCAASQRETAQALARPGLHCAVIDTHAPAGSARRPVIGRSADDSAAIYYTSGTTGTPKGIALSHRHFLHRAWLSSSMLEIAPGDRISQIPEVAFVTAAADVLISLLAGATVCPFDARSRSLAGLAAWINDERVTVLRMPVALFHQFLESLAEADRFPHVRFVQPAGKLLRPAVDRLRTHFVRECRIVRQLAATETSVIVTMMLDHQSRWSGATVPVGYPVPGKEVWLEDADGARVGGNAVGEIVVRSRYLYSGIWGRPETFLRSGEPRVHRMGDLARWLPDGSLEFVGRTDSRVKVRGFTVDLEHVEAAIGNTDLVVDVAVVANERASGDAALAAYVVPAHPVVKTEDIRVSLARSVPDYMIPGHFVVLDALPLMPTGKVDRAALPGIGGREPEAMRNIVPPSTPVEARVRAIWTDVLGIDPIGIHEDFLAIGGDSLMATRIASRVFAMFGVDLAPRELFDASTVARMAALIDQHRREAEGP